MESILQKMSVYGQLEELKLRLPTAKPTIKQGLTNISLQSYEILYKFFDGLHDIFKSLQSLWCKNAKIIL